jgi:hypothetical protein
MEQPKASTGINEAGTNVEAFIQDLDGGMFEKKLSLALSDVAAATCDNGGEGEVVVKFSFKKIQGTSQVHCKHTLNFCRPTSSGEASEKESRITTLHVGKFGRLSLAPENQMTMFERNGDIKHS